MIGAFALAVFVIAACGVAGVVCYKAILALDSISKYCEKQSSFEQYISELQLQIDDLQAQVNSYEIGQRRHTHATAAGLEDALAIMVDVLNEYEESRMYTEARLLQLDQLIKIIRIGPHSYDPERPAGLRPKKRRDKSL